MTAAILLQLGWLLENTKGVKEKLVQAHPANDQWDKLSSLSEALSAAAKAFHDEIRMKKERRSKEVWEKGGKYRSRAQTRKDEFLKTGQIHDKHNFRRNMATIFAAHSDVMVRTDVEERSELIQALGFDGVIWWALAFPPSTWTRMSSDNFACLLEFFKPQFDQTWPPEIRETLYALETQDMTLNSSSQYKNFLSTIADEPILSRERRQHEGQRHDQTMTESTLSTNVREVKHAFSSSPATSISKMPEPFKSAIQRTVMWKREREQAQEETGCWTIIFPKNEEQDVSFSFFCGHDDAYQLAGMFGAELMTDCQF